MLRERQIAQGLFMEAGHSWEALLWLQVHACFSVADPKSTRGSLLSHIGLYDMAKATVSSTNSTALQSHMAKGRTEELEIVIQSTTPS